MGLLAEADLAARCQPIELLVADVDGVLTDGVIALDDEGVETKHFHVSDGMAFALWHRAGKQAAILSGRRAGPSSAARPSSRSPMCSRGTNRKPLRYVA